MKRRQLLTGVAGIAGAGVLGFGSGAFSNATAQREVTVELEDDITGVLELNPGAPIDQRSRVIETGSDNDIIKFSFPGVDEEASPNVDARIQYENEYVTDPTLDPTPLFQIANQGTEKIQLSDEPVGDPGSDEPAVGIFDANAAPGDDGRKPLLRDDEVVLPPTAGENRINAGIEVDTFGLNADETYEAHVYISGHDPEDDSPPRTG